MRTHFIWEPVFYIILCFQLFGRSETIAYNVPSHSSVNMKPLDLFAFPFEKN